MRRRSFLAGVGAAAAPSVAAAGRVASTAGLLPRKVIVGTVMQPFWVKHPGLEKRLGELTALIDQLHEESARKFRRGLDLAILPEVAITGEAGNDAFESSVPYEGLVRETFARKAREHRCYVVVPAYLRESQTRKLCSNAAVLVDRRGETAGTYRKVHLVPSADGKRMEGGATPGNEMPVFSCDFGKLAIQICYDMEFDRGWKDLASQGAELIAWPTQSPQTAQPAFRAMQQRCYIVSSTWRNNASVFEPTGKIPAQVKPPGRTLVEEIDLSYALLPWSSALRNGKALQEKYRERIGYRYYEDEDCGIFWSNDPGVPVRQMAQSLGLVELEDQLARVRDFYHTARVLD